MALPHTAFVGAYVGFKLLFPSLVKWLAYDTYTTALISIWYPLIMTLSWVHEKRNPDEVAAAARPTTKSGERKVSSSAESSASDDQRPSYMRSTAVQKSRDRKKRVSSVFSRTNPPKPENPARGSSPKRSPAKRPSSPAMNLFTNEPEAATRYWLRYWVVFALVQSLGTFGTLVPVFGSFVVRHPYVLHVCSELKLLFFVWLFAMEKIIGAAVVEEESLMAKAMPLALIHEHVAPLLLEFDAVVAESVSRKTWMSLVHSKAQRILEVLVMLKIISEERKEWLLHVLEESRTLLLPSLSLFMPSFITSFGVAYVQFIVPSAKSARALKAAQQRSKFSFEQKEEYELLYLQYWVVHCLVSGLLAYFAGILWWIPFSTHAIFILWCHLSLPKSILQSYCVLEMELLAFGLLPGESSVELHETRTARVLQAVYSRLPSAADIYEGDASDEQSARIDALEKEKESSSAQLGKTISVDSQETNVEVSIRETKVQAEPLGALAQGSSDAEIDSPDENVPPQEQCDKMNRHLINLVTETSSETDDEEEWLPSAVPSGSSSTAETPQDFGSEDKLTVNTGSYTLRRSTRQRRKVQG